jgi:hypothetical protein
MCLYADGRKLAESNFDIPMSMPAPAGPLILGNVHRTYDRPANALIDEVRILDFPLEGDEGVFAPPALELTDTIVGGVVAVGGPAAAYRPELRRYYAYRCAQAPTVDGDLGDPCWREVPAASGFISLDGQRLPVAEQTEVQACHDDTTLYLAVRCHEDAMDALETLAQTNQDMQVFADDAVEVFLSADPRGMPCLQLGVTPANVTCGLFYQADRRLDRDRKGIYRSAVRKGEREWTLELAFPFADFAAPGPKPGDLWRWNVCRDRRAHLGLQYSTMNFITAAFLSPEEYGELIFADQPRQARAAEEAELNRDAIARWRQDSLEFAARIAQDLALVARVPPEAKQAAALDTTEASLEAAREHLLAQARPQASPSISEWNATRLELKALRRQLSEFAYLAGGLGPTAGMAPAPNTEPGVTEEKGYYRLTGTDLVAAVDSGSGALGGLWERRSGRRLLSSGYDTYQAETRSRGWRSDERLDRVESVTLHQEGLELTCTNPDLPGVVLRKRYTFAAVADRQRLLCRRLEVAGSGAELALLKLSANAIFDRAFRDPTYYDRVFVIGTMGEPRSQVPAKEIREPLMQRAWFNSTEGRAQFALVDPGTWTGLAGYLYRVNDRWSYPQAMPQSYWTPFGWEMGYGAAFLPPAGSGDGQPTAAAPPVGSFEVRYHLFQGDHLVFHREYLALPEHAAVMKDWTPHPDAVRILANSGGNLEAVTNHSYAPLAFGTADGCARPDEIVLALMGPSDQRWGVWPASDGEEIAILDAAGKETHRVPCTTIRQAFADLHRLYPRWRGGFYNFIADLHTAAPACKEHPEWVLKDKNGRPVPGVYGPSYVAANWCPAFIESLTQSLLRTVDYYDQDVLYLDFGPGSILADWERGEVVQLSRLADFLKTLQAELARRGKLLWLNSFTGQYYYDVGYHECDGAAPNLAANWRAGAAINLARRLYTRPGTACIPLYWRGGEQFVLDGSANEDRYRDLILACGLMATGCWLDPYQKHFPDGKGSADWAAVFQYQAAVPFATSELLRSEVAEIGLAPAHWRDLASEYETYTLRQGPAFLLNVISHARESRPAVFTVDPAAMGFSPAAPVFFWQFVVRDPKDFPKQVPAAAGWDRLFARYQCQVLAESAPRLALSLDGLVPERVRLTCITQQPGFLYSASGKRTQLLLPEALDCSLLGRVDDAGRRVEVSARMGQPGEVLLWFPESWGNGRVTAAGQPLAAEPLNLGGERFLKVALPAGTSQLAAQAEP